MPSNTRRKKRNQREIVFLILLAIGIGYGIYAFKAYSAQSDKLRAFFETDSGRVGPFLLEVADTQGERSRGLMFRKPGEMQADEGMLFVFPNDSDHSFWMKNTYISLDMLFVNSSGRVVGILHSVPVLNMVPRTVGKTSRYVVELLAGTAKAQGIEVGDTLDIGQEFPTASS